jgi:hypothetical protein
MVTPLRPLAIALLLCAAGASAAARTDLSHAGDRCESAVADTVRRVRGPQAKEVQFIGAKRALTPNGEEEMGVKGEGRYWSASTGAVPFSYSCAFNAQTGGTSGVMFRETGATAGATEAAWQPDLSHLSPDACEAATAVALKDKYPRVGRIAFDSDTRKLRPATDDRTSLEGQGAVERAPGMHSVPFSYRCEVETRSGKVVNVQTSERL